MEIKNDLREYGYFDQIPLSSRCEQIKDYLDKKIGDVSDIREVIKDTITDSMSDYDEKFCHTNCHIERAKKEIIHKIDDCGHCDSGCCCELATKEDISNAIEEINEHTDCKFDEINFKQEFHDLNEQIREINNKLG